MPLANIFPFLRSLTPMPEDVTPGEGSGVLQLQDPDLTLGMLICFEDLLPHKAQERVLEGADVFVNQTNDAWFDPLWGSEAHMAHAVFRSVEQRRPTVRATNSGVSGWIDVRGIVRDELRDPQTGRVQIRGSIPLLVEVAPSPEQTFYTQRPWVFPAAWVLLSIPLFVPLVKKRNS